MSLSAAQVQALMLLSGFTCASTSDILLKRHFDQLLVTVENIVNNKEPRLLAQQPSERVVSKVTEDNSRGEVDTTSSQHGERDVSHEATSASASAPVSVDVGDVDITQSDLDRLSSIHRNDWRGIAKRLTRFYRPNVTCPKVRCRVIVVGWTMC